MSSPVSVSSGASASARRALLIRRISSYVFLVGVPAVWLLGSVVHLVVHHFQAQAGFDLRAAFLPAAHAVIHGDSPYPGLRDPSLASQTAYVYTPFVAFVLSPLLAVSANIAVGIGLVAALVCVPAVLYLAGVRDVRCYGVVLAWSPTYNAVQNLNISLLIAFGVALAWRYRSSARLSGIVLAATLATKVFVWPLLLWPLAARRRRLFVVALVGGLLLVVVSWLAIGFAGLADYPRLLRSVTGHEETDSYSISGALRVLGLGVVAARGAALLATGGLLGACLVFGRRGDEGRALVAAVLASLASTPVLWQHYLMLLLVALAVVRPRLSVAWFLPILLWLSPTTGNGSSGQTLLVPLVAAAVGAACLLPAEGPWPLVGRFRRAAATT